MEQVNAKCLLCGKVYVLLEDDRDFKKVSDPDKPGTYICDLCSNRVRYESDEKKKNLKPHSN
ncbi:MAG: DUF2197 domain-containing protein [Syntrophomonadaceae bacterium]|nr:DUF2197 domain-containing protein [Syntrophomonadaceae bacterium]